MDKREQVVRFVKKRLAQWEDGDHRAELARLRRGIGKKPGELPELWGLLFQDLPEELMSLTGEPTRGEWAVSGALTLYALHRQGTKEAAHAEGQSLGMAVRRLAGGEEERLKAVQRRFNAFATARTMPECMHHLRGLVQLMRSREIALDYAALAGDLYLFQIPERAADVRLRWGQDFYRYVFQDEKGKGERDD